MLAALVDECIGSDGWSAARKHKRARYGPNHPSAFDELASAWTSAAKVIASLLAEASFAAKDLEPTSMQSCAWPIHW